MTFSSPSWRSLNYSKRSLNHPKKVRDFCVFFCWFPHESTYLMVDGWFGALRIGVPLRIPFCWIRGPQNIQTTGPQTTDLPLVEWGLFMSWGIPSSQVPWSICRQKNRLLLWKIPQHISPEAQWKIWKGDLSTIPLFLRIFQHTPGTYPRPPTNGLWRNSFYLGFIGVFLDC